jgi:predicted nucleic acid-binding protein
MNDKYLIDTDVLIDYLRSEPNAVFFLENCKNKLYISTITVAELYSGIRNPKERKIISEFLSVFELISIDNDIAIQGGLIRNEFFKSYGIGLADAIIAATSIHSNCKLISLNYKHFKMFDNLIVPYQKN